MTRSVAMRGELALGAMLAMLAGLATAVHASATVGELDTGLLGDVRGGMPAADGWIEGLTALGSSAAIVVLVAVAVAVLVSLGERRAALVVALSLAASELAVTAMKLLVARPRPPAGEAVVEASGYSFPSGHTAAITALSLGLVLAVGLRARPRQRLWLALVALALSGAVGASRVYLGVHYPTDVMAGWLVGAAAATAAWTSLPATAPQARVAAWPRRSSRSS